jgi:TolB-like protein/Tfp pilus assembly protein PilF
MADARLVFGPFILDTGRGVISRGGTPVPLGQRALAVLAALAESPGRTVAKEELLTRAWPGTVVEEGNLTVQIAALRKALGEGQDWIVTVPRVGYRLALSVSAAELAPMIPSLAVLPFANLGGGDQDWFADGIVADIIAALSRFRSFAVVARTSSFVYKGRAIDIRQVARELGVRYLLEGGVRRSGERLRITAELVDGERGAQIWARSFDGRLDDVFDFQDRITEEVTMLAEPRIQAAEIERSRRVRPGSFASYDVYLRALAGISSEIAADNAEAYALLLDGLKRDPDNPLLLAHAAWAIEHRNTMGWPPFGHDDRARCRDFARRGLDRAAGDALLMAHCGMSLLQGAREYDWGMAVLLAAVEANPNNQAVLVRAAVGHLHCGDPDEALALVRRADRLSPGDRGAHHSLCTMADVAMIRGQYAEALDFATRSFARNPNFDPTIWVLIAANAHLGRMAEARHYCALLRELAPGVTISRIAEAQPAKDPTRIAAIVEGLRLAGLPEA